MSDDIFNCDHENVERGKCLDCGKTFITLGSDYGESKSSVKLKASEKSLKNDLLKLPYPEDIKNKAEEIFQRLNTTTRRGRRRKQLVFFCIYSAYKELGLAKDPKGIAITIGIKPSSTARAVAMYSESQTGYRSKDIDIDPLSYIPEYCEQLQILDMAEPCIEFCKGEILERFYELSDRSPQKIACGFLCYFLDANGFEVDFKKIAQVVGLSAATIKNTFTEIKRLDNEEN
jgi:transcription initiation factor TFIIIB Brf1 subunit/transcription initiation factor TFIIB